MTMVRRMRRWIQQFLGVSRSQAQGMVVLLGLMFLWMVLPWVVAWWDTPSFSREADARILDSLMAGWHDAADPGQRIQRSSTAPHNDRPGVLFPFNPNHTSADSLMLLGMPRHLATRITHYRQKGGSFRVKADLHKIYGMDATLYARLYPYIQLPDKAVEVRDVIHDAKPTPAPRFDLNTADTLLLQTVPGIGVVLSRRIVRYREALGGFVDVMQLQEVYHLDTTVVRRLQQRCYIREDFQPRQLLVNEATVDVLSAHPYLAKSAARAIVAFRWQHGRMASPATLAQVTLLDSTTRRKILPYLRFD